MHSPERRPPDLIHSEEFLRSLMRRQLRLSIGCALAFMGMLILLPIANYLLPDLMARRVAGGFTISWFLLGIGFFPAVWAIAFIFIRRSIALEDAEVREARESQDGKGSGKEGGR